MCSEMSFRDCIDNGEKEGALTKEQAEDVRSRYDELYEDNLRVMSPAEAARQASKDAFDGIEHEAIKKRQRIVLQKQAQAARLADVLSLGDSPAEGLTEILERSGRQDIRFSNVESRRNSVRAMAFSRMDKIFETMKRTAVLGRVSKKSLDQGRLFLRELFEAGSTGDEAASVMAKAWKEASESLRLQFNKAGGDIPSRADWGMPQAHDAVKVQKATFETWYADIKDQLDFEKIISEKTGKRIPEAERKNVMEEVYQTIVNDGLNKISDEQILRSGGRSLARRRQDHRFLVFKSADDWMDYQMKYGDGDPFSIMINHIDSMSRDIALLEILGPNPNSTAAFLETQLAKRAKAMDAKEGGNKNTERLRSESNKFKNMMDHITGAAYTPVNQTMARTFAGLGELLTAALLGSTSILAIMLDTGSARLQAKLIGMPQIKTAARMIQSMARSKMTKMEALRAGLIAEHWTAVAYGQARYAGELMSPKMVRFISNAAMNASLLSPWTGSARWSFGMEFMGFLADNAKKSFNDLPDALKNTMRRYGISEEDWSKISKANVHEYKGATFMRPEEIRSIDEGVSFKVLEMIQEETNLAIPVSTIRAKAALTGGTKRGTLLGELANSVAQFKNFPITYASRNLMQAVTLDGGMGNKIRHGVDLMVTTTMMGAMAMQLREMAKGRDPIEMFDEKGVPNPRFWGAAFLTSGGLGIFGDFAFSGLNRFGGGLGETIAGPRIGFLSDLKDLVIGNIAQAIDEDQDTNFARELIDFAGRYAPFASTFYLRLPLQRLALDQMQMMADPKAEQRFRRSESKRKRETGQDSWWSPGRTEPQRAPDIGAAFGQ
jgi:hypothetical protein